MGTLSNGVPGIVACVVLMGVLIAAAVSDVSAGKVYNRLTYPALLGGLAYNSLVPSAVGAESAFIGAFGGGAFFLAFFVYGIVKGGDVKLIGVVGAWVGHPMVWRCIVASCFVGVLLALIELVRAHKLLTTVRGMLWSAISMIMPGTPTFQYRSGVGVPFGLAVCIGTSAMLLGSSL